MGIDYSQYFAESFERYGILKGGYLEKSHIPYVVLKNGIVFFDLPVEKDSTTGAQSFIGVRKLIKSLEFRYFQTNRALTQHTRYNYNKGDVVVEIGAFLGHYSIYVAQQIGPLGRMVAIEMVPENFEILRLNLMTNFPESAIAVNKGILNRRGRQTASFGGEQVASFRDDVVRRYRSSIQTVDVETDTMDNILNENRIDKVDLMIIQVNGNELEVLDGMRDSLEKINNLSIAAPYNTEGLDHGEVIAKYLSGNGFDVEVVMPWIYARRRSA